MKKSFFLLFALFLISCGNVGTGVSNPPTKPLAQSALLTVHLFTASANTNQTKNLKIPQEVLSASITKAQLAEGCGMSDPGCSCSIVGDGLSPSDFISASSTGQAGTYGSTNNSIELIAEDFCDLTEGFSNTGFGPDNLGLFASFTLAGNLSGSCTNGDDSVTITMQSTSAGVYRNTLSQGDTPAYEPQVYATYDYEVDGIETRLDCTIYLLEDQSIDFADCTDAQGNTVEQESDFTCELLTVS